MSWSEKDFEESMTPYIDAVYDDVFGNRLVSIERTDRDKESDSRLMFMDQELAIDTHLTFRNGSILTFQEKSRRYKYYKFGPDFTFEYYNDPRTKEEGEWFKLASQLYFYGFANQNELGYYRYWIIHVARLRTQLMSRYPIHWMEENWLRQNKPPAKSNFFCIPFSVIERLDDVVLYKGEYGLEQVA